MSVQSADNLLRHTTSDEFAVVCSRIEAACAQHKFGVINSVDMQAKMQSKGLEFAERCTVFEVCNPGAAKAVLTAHMDLASALPCRIAVFTEGSSTVLSTLKPTLLLGAYAYADVLSEASQVEKIMDAIMAIAAGKQ